MKVKTIFTIVYLPTYFKSDLGRGDDKVFHTNIV